MMDSNLSTRRPKVSVLMITYNHEKFIEQAVRSVMMQETDFDYELIIGEDCSTDRTREIVLQLKEEFPDKIRLLLHEKNIGMIPNMIATYNACTGEYIALCEGDDYWTHPKKLQIQVDYMDAHPECRLSFHKVKVIYEEDPHRTKVIESKCITQSIDVTHWLEYLYIATGSVVFRIPDQWDDFPPIWYTRLQTSGDWPLFLWLHAQGGEFHEIVNSIPLSVYRIHENGVTNQSRMFSSKARQQRLERALEDVQLVSGNLGKYQKGLMMRQLSIRSSLVSDYLATGNNEDARRHLKVIIGNIKFLSKYNIRKILKLIMLCYAPSLHNVASRVWRQRKLIAR